ncbi:hypothetical protein JNN96_36960 [Mycobacterium sp. DSM 3803]|nr:hypothetical protein [Mycobacterium sp. DSM 3803]
MLVGGGVVALKRWHDDRNHRAGDAAVSEAAPAPIGTPQDLFISFPLDRQPVTGWRLTATDIGLPPGDTGTLVGTSGKNAFFLASRGCDKDCSDPVGWVYGIDTDTGATLFPPVPLRGLGTGSCHLNGSHMAVCVASPTPGYEDTLPPPTVWTIDLGDGSVMYSGPTDLDTTGGPKLVDVGNFHGETRVVAAVEGEGLHGVGPRGELTWFVPGDGDAEMLPVINDIPPMTLAIQNGSDAGEVARVYSTETGKDLTPAAPDGTTIESPQIYNGGFAYEFSEEGGKAGILFFDSSGKLVHRQEGDRGRLQRNTAMPVVMVGSNLHIFTAAGTILAQVPASDIISESQIIGTKLYLSQGGVGENSRWQQWDLLSGTPGPICHYQLGAGYVGSDGNVILTQREIGGEVVALDPATCDTIWTVPDNRTATIKVGSNLIQINPDNTVSSLRAPN